MDRPFVRLPVLKADAALNADAGLHADAAPEPGRARGVMTRRTALQGLATGLGAGLAFPLPAGAGHDHPVLSHAAQRPASPTPENGPERDAEPVFLDAHQFATVTVLAELIVPGAVASASDRFIDASLAVETPDTQQRFVTALGAVDGAAIAQHRQPFKDLAEADQIALLEEAFGQSSGRPSPKPWQPGEPVIRPSSDDGPSSDDSDDAAPPAQPALTLRDHVDHLKGWIAGAHYSSEAGMKELGWTGNMFFESFPGCTHPDGHKSA